MQDRLFTLAPEVLVINANFVGGDGWSVNIGMRRQGDPWATSHRVTYSHLTATELADVIEVESHRLLGLL